MSVSHRAAARLRQGQVWVYRSDLLTENSAEPGSYVAVRDERGKFLGTALYSSTSQIALRLLTPHPVSSQDELFQLVRDRLRNAIQYRLRLLGDNNLTNAYRVVFSEADGLPGLIVDRYNDLLSLQAQTQAMDRAGLKDLIISELVRQFAPAGVSSVIERVDSHIRELEQLPPAAAALRHGHQSSTVYQMNGVRFHYDALSGQKTGAFLDQRENYAAAARYAGGNALDAFCYQGGFALHLARLCSAVTALDSSRPALQVAEQNEQLNAAPGMAQIEWIEANAFDLLNDYSRAGRQYDTIVLDPPAFAKSKRALPAALRGYKELNLRALKMLRQGGVLITCSCSHHVSEQDFLEMLSSAAADAHASLRLIEQRTQSPDHPILLEVPETRYLKCLICQRVN